VAWKPQISVSRHGVKPAQACGTWGFRVLPRPRGKHAREIGVSISRHTAEGRARARETWGFHVPPPDENRGFPCFYAALETWGFHDDGNRRPSLGNWWCFETADPSLWELRVFFFPCRGAYKPASISPHDGQPPQFGETRGFHFVARRKISPSLGNLGFPCPAAMETATPARGTRGFHAAA
jgi:hypothetical protein